MGSDWREFTGFGELLCLVLAWTVGLAALWADVSSDPGANKIAAGSQARPAELQ